MVTTPVVMPQHMHIQTCSYHRNVIYNNALISERARELGTWPMDGDSVRGPFLTERGSDYNLTTTTGFPDGVTSLCRPQRSSMGRASVRRSKIAR